jgi:hypothetical protein
MRTNFRWSEWRRAVPVCGIGRLLPAAIAHLVVGLTEHPMSKRRIDTPGKGLIQFDDVSGSVRGAILV